MYAPFATRHARKCCGLSSRECGQRRSHGSRSMLHGCGPIFLSADVLGAAIASWPALLSLSVRMLLLGGARHVCAAPRGLAGPARAADSDGSMRDGGCHGRTDDFQPLHRSGGAGPGRRYDACSRGRDGNEAAGHTRRARVPPRQRTAPDRTRLPAS
jgi:hypothetical protein